MKKSEKTKLTVDKIIDAAMLAFGADGYVGGTVNNICKSGINKGLVYHNFKDKDELYLTCLKISCARLTDFIKSHNGKDELSGYMNARMNFICEYPNEARIFFDALINPPPKLYDRIRAEMREFDELTEGVYLRLLESVELRVGVTKNDALGYFSRIKKMFNLYFANMAKQGAEFDELLKVHENEIPKMIELMLYGIAKGDD